MKTLIFCKCFYILKINIFELVVARRRVARTFNFIKNCLGYIIPTTIEAVVVMLTCTLVGTQWLAGCAALCAVEN